MNAIIFSALWGVVMMYTGVASGRGRVATVMAILGGLALATLSWLEFAGLTVVQVDTRGLLSFTPYSLLFLFVLYGCTLAYLLLSGADVEKVGGSPADLYALLFFILTGVALAATFNSLLMLFLAMEIISIPLYILAASDKRNLKSNEAGLKYFLMGAFSTGLMLMGIALLYGTHGTFVLEGMNLGMSGATPMAMVALVLMLASMSFKVSAAPFHFWTPDVYDGTPTVFTSFMATVVKAAGFFAFMRLFEQAFGKLHDSWQLPLAVITALTLLIGNVAAVFQQSVKRMLAYSSIAQAGFMMMAPFALNTTARHGLLLYAAAYCLATIGIFSVLTRMKDYTYEGFNGLAKRQPLVAAMLTVFLFSLAGIPLTAGFFAKYYMLVAALKTGDMPWLPIMAVLCAAVSVYYYFRVVQAMYFREASGEAMAEVPTATKALLVATALLVIALGVQPDLLLRLAV